MKPFLRVAAATTMLMLMTSVSHAALTGDSLTHARSSFQFANNKDWENAIGHARKVSDKALLKLITWEYLLDVDSGATFSEITQFMRANPNWPEQKKLRLRAEMALRDSAPDDAEIIAWFGNDMPVSGVGKLALAEALARLTPQPVEKITYLIRDAWRNGDFDENQENLILADYMNVLRREDDATRVDRLVWEGKTAAAKRMAYRLSGDQQKLLDARLALIDDAHDAPERLAKVPAALRSDPGLLYERIRYAIRNDDEDTARDMLMNVPDHLPYPVKWWKLREGLVRRAIDEQDYGIASRLLARHGQLDGPEFADASWLRGWLALEFAGQPQEAFSMFQKMYDNVKFPVSRSRAAYWSARALEKTGSTAEAARWYETAASYPSTFYGQMAILKGDGILRLPGAPSISAQDKKDFEDNELARAVRICVQLDSMDFASHLLSLLMENETNPAMMAQIAEIGKEINKPYLSVRSAKKALQQNVVLINAGYPRPATPADLPIERALALAITRQESEFDPTAKSKAGALGMMQLLPGTAKEVAKKAAVGFSHARLREPEYNMMLGSHYLSRVIDRYDGSYVMGIASYNAGPGNVRKWTQQYGTAGGTIENSINWIEKIPFSETRNYVQRVLENVQVYRYLENGSQPMKLLLKDDLER